MTRIGVVIMQGKLRNTPQERLVDASQSDSIRSMINVLEDNDVDEIIFAAPHPFFYVIQYDPLWYDIDDDDKPFHFGQRLAELVEQRRFDAVIYLGAGSIYEMRPEQAERMIKVISKPEPAAITNNLYSSDWFAFNHADRALPIIRGELRDNSVAWLLKNSGQFLVEVFPTGIDIDTPADVVLAHNLLPQNEFRRELLHKYHAAQLTRIPLNQVLDILRTEGSHVMLIGRVPPDALTALNKAVRVWTRVISEERGMVASGREARGEVRSVLVPWINARGLHGFFEDLAGMTDAVLFDTRVLWAALGKSFSAADRFAADLFMADAISDPWLREFTEAAASVNIPIIMGGHSVVSAGVQILADAAKAEAKKG
jgi:hypothetical protein